MGPIGLDDRPRPASSRARIIKGLKQSAPFSSLQRRIIFFNLVGLALLVAGMTYLSNDRQNLIQIYVEALRTQGQIIAIGVSETAVENSGEPSLSTTPASRARCWPAGATWSGVRIRLYDEDSPADGRHLLSHDEAPRTETSETPTTAGAAAGPVRPGSERVVRADVGLSRLRARDLLGGPRTRASAATRRCCAPPAARTPTRSADSRGRARSWCRSPCPSSSSTRSCWA